MAFVNGGNGGETLTGVSNENNQLYGMGGNDILVGANRDDYLEGGDGDDVITGGLGGDALVGGAGADRFVYLSALDSGPAGYDQLLDFESGIDKIDLRGLSVASASILRENGSNSSYVFIRLTNGELLTILAAGRTVNANDLLLAQPVGVFVTRGEPGESIAGSEGPDTLYGSIGPDRIYGNGGNDVIIGGAGGDVLYGGAGADTFTYTAITDSNQGGFDALYDFQTRTDLIDLRPLNLNQLSVLWQEDGSSFVFVTSSTGAVMTLLSASQISTSDFLLANPNTFFVLSGSSIAEIFTGGTARDNFYGGGGADLMFGGANSDFLNGQDGDDTLYGDGETDTLDGGAGNDILYGDAGGDSMNGGLGRDIYAWRAYEGALVRAFESVVLNRAEGDTLRFDMASAFGVTLTRVTNFQTQIDVVGGAGETLLLNFFQSILSSDLTFVATPAFFTIDDRAGASTFSGGIRSEFIIGGSGGDIMTGGGGADLFRYLSASDSSITATPDRILDFVSGDDKLDFRPLGSNIVVNLGFTGNACFVYVDVDGNGTNDMMIILSNVLAVSPNDFVMTGRFGGPAAAIPEPEPAAALIDAGDGHHATPLPWAHPGDGDWFLAA